MLTLLQNSRMTSLKVVFIFKCGMVPLNFEIIHHLSRKKKLLKLITLYHNRNIRLTTASNIKRRSLNMAFMQLSSDRLLLFLAPQYYNEHCFAVLRISNKQVALGVGSAGIKLTVESPWMSVLTQAWNHVVRYCFWLWRQSGVYWYGAFKNSRNSIYLLRIEQSRARIDDVWFLERCDFGLLGCYAT
jgi:hypothetical protein